MNNYSYGVYVSGGDNNTLRNNVATNNTDMGFRIESSSKDNNITGNNASNNVYGFFLQYSADRNLLRNNTAKNNQYGIYLGDSTLADNQYINNNATGNTLWDFYAKDGVNGGIVTNLTLTTTKISFTAKAVSIKYATSPATDPIGYGNISKYLTLNNTGSPAWIFLNISYNDVDVPPLVDETSLTIQRWNGTNWSLYGFATDQDVDYINNWVWANISNFSTYAPMGTEITCTDNDGDGYNTEGGVCGIVDCDDTNANIYPLTNGTITQYINGNTTLCTGTYNLNLTTPNGAVWINKSNIILDCNGSLIFGDGTNGYGIKINSSFTNITVKNCNIQYYSQGISLAGGTYHNITNNNIDNNNAFGMYITSSGYNTISNNNITNSPQFGIYLSGEQYDTLINNNIRGNGLDGLLADCEYTTITNNTADNNQYGYHIFSDNNNNLTGNTANNNSDMDYYIEHSSYNTLTNNIANNSDYGFYLDSANYNNLTSNTAYNNVFNGFRIATSSYNNLIENNETIAAYGFSLTSSFYNTLSNNNANDNTQSGFGLFINSYNNTLQGNRADSNSFNGFHLATSSSNNTLNNNNATNNRNGFYIDNSNDNTLNNNYADNIDNAFVSITNAKNNQVNNLTTNNLILSFLPLNIALYPTTAPATDPSNYYNISKYISITNNSATSWINLNLSYEDSDVIGYNESTLTIMRYNGTAWNNTGFALETGLDTTTNWIWANISNFSVYAPMVQNTTAPIPPSPNCTYTMDYTNGKIRFNNGTISCIQTWNVSYNYYAMGYVTDSTTRTTMGLISVLAAIVIIVALLNAILKGDANPMVLLVSIMVAGILLGIIYSIITTQMGVSSAIDNVNVLNISTWYNLTHNSIELISERVYNATITLLPG
jgi:parallel beta-helix repeat protein